MSYMTRALKARDPRFARILSKLGYSAPIVAVVEPALEHDRDEPDIEGLRQEYEDLAGEPADKRWGAARLKSELAAIEG